VSRSRAACGLIVLLHGACALRPGDAFAVAERSLQRRDLAAALQALDAVPVAHARYPEARAAALEVERNMRRCHELMLEAMLLRSEWRDDEALVSLQRVRQIWPDMPGVDVLIAATTQRRQLFGEPPVVATTGAEPPPAPPAPTAEVAGDAPRTPVASLVHPVAPGATNDPAPGPTSSAALVPTPPPSPPSTPPPATPPPVATAASLPASPVSTPPATPPTASQPAPATPVAHRPVDEVQENLVTTGLVAIEARLGRGQLEAAVNDLLDLAQQFPADARVRVRLVRVLNQRALLRYGDGYVSLAIDDWRRVLELDPHNVGARRMLEAAELENR